jgi:hypothetical protein
MCWPAYIAGAFFVALVAFDIFQKDYSSLPQHGVIGVCVTGLLWLLCFLIGPSITMATLVVPLIFIGIFLFSVWIMNESMKARGCCMSCNGDKKKKAYFVKREEPKSEEPKGEVPTSPTCIPSLKAVTL